MSIVDRPLTLAEYSHLPDNGRKSELVRGRIVEMNPPKPRHGRVMYYLAKIVGRFVEEHDLGHWLGETGVVTTLDPDSVRGPDGTFVSYSRLPRDADDNEYIQVAPELVFEILSEDDRWSEVYTKIGEYLRSGIDVVCVLEPELRMIHLHRRTGSPATLKTTDTLEFPDILPGFRCLVADLFPPPRTPAS